MIGRFKIIKIKGHVRSLEVVEFHKFINCCKEMYLCLECGKEPFNLTVSLWMIYPSLHMSDAMGLEILLVKCSSQFEQNTRSIMTLGI